MKNTPQHITIRELANKYIDSPYSGVRGYGTQLNIRPAYQREMVYTEEEEKAVIESILDGFPIGVMYWAKNPTGKPTHPYEYEVIDGQQRTISICQYVELDKFDVRGKLFSMLDQETKDSILEYEILVYLCEGTDAEKLAWFKRINIAGKALSAQELRNAVYTGDWLTSAKDYFKSEGPAQKVSSGYLKTQKKTLENRNFVWNRWDGLELAISWAAGGKDDIDIMGYMAQHQGDPDAKQLFADFEAVFNWIENTFGPYDPSRSKYLEASDWHEMYLAFGSQNYNVNKLRKLVDSLMMDDEITNKHGIYWYVLDPVNNEPKLNIRSFDKDKKTTMYAEQGGRCPICHIQGSNKKYKICDMEADHIIPWSKGGKTTLDNGAMLCSLHNNLKNNKTVDEEQVKDALNELRKMAGYPPRQ